MPLVIPFTFVGGPGNKAKASEVNANFEAVKNKFTSAAGGITTADIAFQTAAIKGGGPNIQLSTTFGERVSTAAIEDEAVTDAKLNNNPSTNPADDPGRAVSGDHIKSLTAAQMARFLPNFPLAGIGSNKLKLTFHEVVYSTGLVNIPVAPVLTGISVAANPTLTFPQATYALVGLYVRTITSTGSVSFASHAPITGNGGGPNWQGAVQILHTGNGGTGTNGGTLVYVFAEKA